MFSAFHIFLLFATTAEHEKSGYTYGKEKKYTYYKFQPTENISMFMGSVFTNLSPPHFVIWPISSFIFRWDHNRSLLLANITDTYFLKASLRGVVAKVLDYNIVVSEFKLQSHYQHSLYP